jgi:cytochrome b6-f complex iron-sulfur subunit
MERKEFLNKISGGLAFTCVACMMAACSKDENTGTGNNTGGGGNTGGGTGNTLLTINLATQLLAINDFVSDKGIIIVRKAAGNVVSSFAAFVNACPHQGVAVTFRKPSNDFYCSPQNGGHGSTFSITGAVTNSPATSGLSARTIEISGTTLSVK